MHDIQRQIDSDDERWAAVLIDEYQPHDVDTIMCQMFNTYKKDILRSKRRMCWILDQCNCQYSVTDSMADVSLELIDDHLSITKHRYKEKQTVLVPHATVFG